MEQLVTRKTAAALLGLSDRTLAKWANLHPTRSPVAVKLGARAVRYRMSEVLAVARGERSEAPSAERAA